jgi:tetratricopeptide (TPR) repeat protein
MGRLDAAEGYYQASYRITFPRDPQGVGITFILDNLGSLAFDRGNFALAESYFLTTLERYRTTTPEGLEVAKCLHNLGLIAGRRHDFKAAAALLERALAIYHRLVPGTQMEAGTLLALAENASLRGDLDRARQLGERAQALTTQISSENVDAASALVILGRIALDRGDLVEAERLAQASLERRLAQGASGQLQARSRILLGDIAFQRRHDERARRQYFLALDLLRSFDPDSVEAVAVLTSLGEIERSNGRRALAEARFAEAIAALEGADEDLGGTEEQLGAFEETYLPTYTALIDLQLARGDGAGALYTLERSRARGLLALLAQRDLVFSADLPAPLRERQRSLDREHAALQARIAALAPRQKREIAARRGEMQHLNARRAALNAEVTRASPRYVALKNPRPLDLAGIRLTLDPGTVYLAYTLGEKTSHLFVVGASGLRVLPLATTRGDAGREVGIFRSLLPRRPGRKAPDAKADAALRGQARRLYDLLLAPAEPDLQAAERILVSPDGALHILPFGALLRPGLGTPYLAAWKPLHTVVSATLYAELKARRRPSPSAASLAAFAAATLPGERQGRPGG